MSTTTLKFIAYLYPDSEVISLLRQQEYDIFYVANGDSNFNEDSICQKANAENYVLLTADEPTASRIANANRVTTGVLLVKLENENAAIARAKIVTNAIAQHANEIPAAYSTLTKQNWKSKKLAIA